MGSCCSDWQPVCGTLFGELLNLQVGLGCLLLTGCLNAEFQKKSLLFLLCLIFLLSQREACYWGEGVSLFKKILIELENYRPSFFVVYIYKKIGLVY